MDEKMKSSRTHRQPWWRSKEEDDEHTEEDKMK